MINLYDLMSCSSSSGLSPKLDLREYRVCFWLRLLVLTLMVSIDVLPSGGARGEENFAVREYQLKLFHTHTGERLDIVYRRGDEYLPDALEQLDHFLRDHRTG